MGQLFSFCDSSCLENYICIFKKAFVVHLSPFYRPSAGYSSTLIACDAVEAAKTAIHEVFSSCDPCDLDTFLKAASAASTAVISIPFAFNEFHIAAAVAVGAADVAMTAEQDFYRACTDHDAIAACRCAYYASKVAAFARDTAIARAREAGSDDVRMKNCPFPYLCERTCEERETAIEAAVKAKTASLAANRINLFALCK